MDDSTTFWVVWNEKSGPPKHRHSDEESAEREALRLAARHPGEEFIVLMSVGAAKKVEAIFNRHYISHAMPF